MRFEFAAPERIIFGGGVVNEIGALASMIGKRVLVVTGLPLAHTARIQDILSHTALQSIIFSVTSEPTLNIIEEAIRFVKDFSPDLVIGFGGGSAIDSGKAISALLTNPGALLDYLEVIGKGKPIIQPPIPFIAIPTTAGTGSEATRNAVLASPEHRIKVSLRSPMMLPKVALIDPQLTYSLPPAITATTGLDALTQLIEPYTCNNPNPISNALCQDGMRRAARSLLRAYEHGSDASAREDLSLASLFSGIALSNARLGAVHGIAGVIGGMLAAPHGAICARLLPFVMQANLNALKTREPAHPGMARYLEVAQILTNRSNATADDGTRWVSTLVTSLSIPPLSDYGISRSDFPILIQKSLAASSMKGNPIPLTPEELEHILEQAL